MAGAANNQPERIGVDDLASADDGVVRIGRLVIAPEQIVWGFSRSSGPGGQNVNKVSSRAELRLNIDELPLAEHERTRLRSLAGLSELLEQALAAPKPRRATKPSKGSKRRRLEDKRQRSEIKRNRGGAGGED
jgi:ribosome-associated protein